MKNDRTLNMKIPSELYEGLKEAAESKNISLSSLVRLICSAYLQKNRNK